MELIPHADEMRQYTLQREEVKTLVDGILTRLSIEIESAKTEKKGYIISKLDTVLKITNTSPAEAQAAVWTNVIKCLKEKKYTVNIDPTVNNGKTCLIKISWLTDKEIEELDKQKKFLSEHTKKLT